MAFKEYIWPDLQDIAETRKVILYGAQACFFIAVATAVVAFCQDQGYFNILPGIGKEAYIDAVIFAVLGCGLLRRMRLAAVAAMCLYFFESYYSVKSGGRFTPLMVIFMLTFINAVRASFSYYELLGLAAASPSADYQALDPMTGLPRPAAAGTAPANAEAAPSGAPEKMGLVGKFGVVAFIVAAGCFGVFMVHKNYPDFFSGNNSGNKSGSGKTAVQQRAAKQAGFQLPKFALPAFPKKAAAPVEAVAPEKEIAGAKTFHLKAGGTVRGRILYEDDTYYTVETLTGEQIVIREDVASIS